MRVYAAVKSLHTFEKDFDSLQEKTAEQGRHGILKCSSRGITALRWPRRRRESHYWRGIVLETLPVKAVSHDDTDTALICGVHAGERHGGNRSRHLGATEEVTERSLRLTEGHGWRSNLNVVHVHVCPDRSARVGRSRGDTGAGGQDMPGIDGGQSGGSWSPHVVDGRVGKQGRLADHFDHFGRRRDERLEEVQEASLDIVALTGE